MKNQYHFTKNVVLVVTLFVFSVFAAEASDLAGSNIDSRFKTIIAEKLTEKLRVELADQTVNVKIGSLQNREVSQFEINLSGDALAVVKQDKTELPLEFSAKANLNNQSIEDITYTFVERASEFAPSAAESNLMKNLMTQISKDYQTTNIVISIDGFDAEKLTSNQTKYEGLGEVRIGDLEWSKIKFNIVFNSQDQKATKILYEVQK